MKNCKTSETKDLIYFLTSNFNLYGFPERIKSDKGGVFISNEYKQVCKNRNIELEYCTPRMHTVHPESGREIVTNTEKLDISEPRRWKISNRKCIPSVTGNVFYNTYGIKKQRRSNCITAENREPN